jgi:secreted trypsin-like serine protease
MQIIQLLLAILIFSIQPVLADDNMSTSSENLPFDIKILGGTESKQGDWPWMTALLRASQPNIYQAQFCGGVLIDPYWVLTAAHCVSGQSTGAVNVAVGAFDLNTFSGSRTSLSAIHIHPSYNTSTLYNDIALLKLSSPSSQPVITLFSGKSLENADPSLLGRTLTAMGWGHADSGASWYYPTRLRQVNLPVVADNECSDIYTRPVASSQICAGFYVGKDVCNGDSGGPLVSQIDGAWVHNGLVSYGAPCADYGGWYGVYTRTSAFTDFIRQYVPNAQFTSSTITPLPGEDQLIHTWLQLLLLK